MIPKKAGDFAGRPGDAGETPSVPMMAAALTWHPGYTNNHGTHHVNDVEYLEFLGAFWRSFVFGRKPGGFSGHFFFQGSWARQHFFWISCMWFQSSESVLEPLQLLQLHIYILLPRFPWDIGSKRYSFPMGSWLDEGIFKLYKYGLKSVFPREYSNFGCG